MLKSIEFFLDLSHYKSCYANKYGNVDRVKRWKCPNKAEAICSHGNAVLGSENTETCTIVIRYVQLTSCFRLAANVTQHWKNLDSFI